MFREELQWGSLISDETVADVSHRFDVNVGGIFYFTAEPPDMDIHGSVSAKIILAPDLIE